MRAIVVGAGVSGLAVAARLAASGHQVRVVDRNEYTGGKISEVSSGGYRFDRGPSLFTLPGELDAVFETTGRDPRDYYRYLRLDTCCRYHFADGTGLRADADPDQFATEVETQFNVPRAQVLRYLQHAKRLYDTTSPLFLRQSLHRASTYATADAFKALADLPIGPLLRSLHDENTRWFADPRLVQLFDRYATYNGSDPFRAPGILSQIPHLEHNLGAYFPVGGMIAIPRALERLCRELGVQFDLGSGVERIRHAGRRVVGVDTSSNSFDADVVVCAGDVVGAYKLLSPSVSPPKRTQQQEGSSSGVIFYWGMKRSFPDLDVHNIFFGADYRREFHDIFERKGVPDDPSIYVHVSAKVEPTDAPAGCENWFVMVNVAPDYGQPWPELIAKLRARVIEALGARLGCRIEEHIEVESHLEPKLIEQLTSSHRGSLYGASSNETKSAFLRHPNFSRQIDGLFFCGGSVHPGGGIPLCLNSANIVAREVGRWSSSGRGRQLAPKALRAPS